MLYFKRYISQHENAGKTAGGADKRATREDMEKERFLPSGFASSRFYRGRDIPGIGI